MDVSVEIDADTDYSDIGFSIGDNRWINFEVLRKATWSL